MDDRKAAKAERRAARRLELAADAADLQEACEIARAIVHAHPVSDGASSGLTAHRTLTFDLPTFDPVEHAELVAAVRAAVAGRLTVEFRRRTVIFVLE